MKLDEAEKTRRAEITRLKRRSRALARQVEKLADAQRELAEVRCALRYDYELTWQSIADNDGVTHGAVRKSVKKIREAA